MKRVTRMAMLAAAILMTAGAARARETGEAARSRGPHPWTVVSYRDGETEADSESGCMMCHQSGPMRDSGSAAWMTMARAASIEVSIESPSSVCISCHDGIMSTHPLVTLGGGEAGEEGTEGKGVSLEAGHPVDVSYDVRLFSRKKRDYRIPAGGDRIDPEGKLRLYPGSDRKASTVQCQTCHDMHSEAAPYLAMSNSRSALCLACHIK